MSVTGPRGSARPLTSSTGATSTTTRTDSAPAEVSTPRPDASVTAAGSTSSPPTAPATVDARSRADALARATADPVATVRQATVEARADGSSTRVSTPPDTAPPRGNHVLLRGPDGTTTDAHMPALDNHVALAHLGLRAGDSPPTTGTLRSAFQRDHAPSGTLIREGRYSEAATAYREAARTAPAEQQAYLRQVASQLDLTARMQAAVQASNPRAHVGFPPTLQEAQSYFHALRGRPPSQVAAAFQEYSGTFYQHVQDRAAGGAAHVDMTYGRGGGTPSSDAHITDGAPLSSTGRRVMDCEGFALLGERLLGRHGAGFEQPREGGFVSVGPREGSGHHMLRMVRGTDSIWVSNTEALGSNVGGEARHDFRDHVHAAFRAQGVSTVSMHTGHTVAEAREARAEGTHPYPPDAPNPIR